MTDQAVRLPHTKVGLLLGCSESLNDGRPNLFFQRRIAAAVELFRAGKIEYLLVSGDHSRADHDEPSDMRRALVAAGVPSSRIVRDSAGFRTLDSVVRAKEVFGLRRFTIISQRFHDLRAVYLARRNGIEAYGFAAAGVGGAEGFGVSAREVVSRVFALLDIAGRALPGVNAAAARGRRFDRFRRPFRRDRPSPGYHRLNATGRLSSSPWAAHLQLACRRSSRVVPRPSWAAGFGLLSVRLAAI